MIKNPEYAKVGSKKYKINTDFRVAIRCNEVAMDDTIGDRERALAIIYLLYGDEGLENNQDHPKLWDLAIKYLKCGNDNTNSNLKEPDMDFIQDFKLIEASFRSDYGIILSQEKMHYWDFFMYLNGLTDKCVLNRIRELRTYDLSEIKNVKEREKIRKLKESYALKKKKTRMTDKQKQSRDKFYELTGLKREEE